MNKYVYIFSNGEYSDYSVNCLLVNEKKYSEEELEELVEEFKEYYTEPEEMDTLYRSAFIEERLFEFLKERGFERIYPIGEINLSYSKIKNLKSRTPRSPQKKDSSFFRLEGSK